jgi:hypothetical protein
MSFIILADTINNSPSSLALAIPAMMVFGGAGLVTVLLRRRK